VKLIALHGFTGSGRDFDPFADALGLPIQAIDLLGHGGAEAPPEPDAYRMSAQVERIVALIDDGPIVLMGYSMGGRVALRLWSRLGSRVRGLILMAAHPGLPDPVARSERIASDMALAAQIESRGVEWFAEHWAAQPIIQSQQHIAPVVLKSMQERRARNRAVGLANTLRGIGQGVVSPVWSELSAIEVPTLLITGADDVKYSRLAAEMVAHIPNGVHRSVEGAGHCVHLESMDVTAGLVREFLASISG